MSAAFSTTRRTVCAEMTPQLHQLWDYYKASGIRNGDAGLTAAFLAPELLPMAEQRVADGTAREDSVEDEHAHLDNVRRRAQTFGALVAERGSEEAALEYQRQRYAPIETRAQWEARAAAEARARMMEARAAAQAQMPTTRSWNPGGAVSPLSAEGLASARSLPHGIRTLVNRFPDMSCRLRTGADRTRRPRPGAPLAAGECRYLIPGEPFAICDAERVWFGWLAGVVEGTLCWSGGRFVGGSGRTDAVCLFNLVWVMGRWADSAVKPLVDGFSTKRTVATRGFACFSTRPGSTCPAPF